MNVTQITVMVHEKRNHPYEYGHYDAEVRYTADVEPGENVNDATDNLRDVAHGHVQAQCNAWLDDIERTWRVMQTTHDIRNYLYWASHAPIQGTHDDHCASAQKLIDSLPDFFRNEYQQKLDKIKADWATRAVEESDQADADADGPYDDPDA